MKTVETEEKDDFFYNILLMYLSTQQHFLKSDHSLDNNIL